MRTTLGVPFLLFTSVLSPLCAEEAIRADGKIVRGSLHLERGGLLAFVSDKGETPIPLRDLRAVRFPQKRLLPLHTARMHRITLPGSQSITGQILSLEGKNLTVRTAWGATLAIPRSALDSIGPLPGYWFETSDDFEEGLTRWRVQGHPSTGEPAVSGKNSVILAAPRDALERTFTPPLPAGRLGLSFRELQSPAKASCNLELTFLQGKSKHAVAVQLSGEGKEFLCTAPDFKGNSFPGARTEGWHRLLVEWRATSIRVFLDGEVLWYCLDLPSPPELAGLNLRWQTAQGGQPTGKIACDAFGMERAADARRRPQGDATQDECWLREGSQLFGTLARIQPSTVEITGPYGTRRLRWEQIRGVFLLRGTPTTETQTGEQVRLTLGLPVPEGRAHLEGVITALDGKTITLTHAILGALTVPRPVVEQIEWLRPGRRAERAPGS